MLAAMCGCTYATFTYYGMDHRDGSDSHYVLQTFTKIADIGTSICIVRSLADVRCPYLFGFQAVLVRSPGKYQSLQKNLFPRHKMAQKLVSVVEAFH